MHIGGVSGQKYLAHGFKWVQDFFSFYRGREIRRKDWSTECCFDNTPSQRGNGTECGVILLATADYLSTDRRLDFTLADMSSYRKHLCIQILSNT